MNRSALILVLALAGAGCDGGSTTSGGDAGSLDGGAQRSDAGGADAGVSLTDAGGGRLVGCVGTGGCESLSEMGCQVGVQLGCAIEYREYCNVRGCATLTMSQCGIDDIGCVWNEDLERCEEDPVCLSLTTQDACAARRCVWVRAASGCSGTYDCASLDALIAGADAGPGPVPDVCGTLSPFGLTCAPRYE